MAGDKAISQLNPKTILGSTDLIPIVDNSQNPGVTEQVSVSVLDERYIAMSIAL